MYIMFLKLLANHNKEHQLWVEVSNNGHIYNIAFIGQYLSLFINNQKTNLYDSS